MRRRSSQAQPARASESYRLSLPVTRISTTLVIVAVVLVILHILMWLMVFKTHLLDNQAHWSSLFDLDTEASFGTWFSSAMLFVAGVLTLMVASRRGASEKGKNWWWFIGYALMVASLDEVAGLHESLNSDPHFTALMGHWTIPAAVLSVVFGLLLVPFFRRLPARTSVAIILAGVVYVSGAVGVEFATIGYESTGTLETLSYNLWNAFEEGLEMLGVILYLWAVLDFMANDGKVVAQVSART